MILKHRLPGLRASSHEKPTTTESPRAGLQCVIVVFPDHFHLFFLIYFGGGDISTLDLYASLFFE